jgi:flagellum-specific ATP synthase
VPPTCVPLTIERAPSRLKSEAPVINKLLQQLSDIEPHWIEGQVRRCRGTLLVCGGLTGVVGLGDTCLIEPGSHNHGEYSEGCEPLLGEVVALDEIGVHILPFSELEGIGLGARIRVARGYDRVRPDPSWLGRVLDPLGRALDAGPALAAGPVSYPLLARPVPAHRRRDLGPRLDLGVRALNLFTPCRRGQRMGIFAGSGIGKSTLLSMLARHSRADALVLGLVGERGREVNLLLHDGLGRDGLARSVVVVATSDMPAMLRRRAAYLTLTVAEALRDRGLSVLCLIDSVTRFAMALREIYLAAGEPPTSKGYPPGVFAELPRLLERAGPGPDEGSITGLFTVLVEGDDLSDPIADALRAILDGHIVLDRVIAEGGRYPALDVLRSLSRSVPGCYQPAERVLVERARRLIRAYTDTAELIQLGAYREGSDPLIDEAIRRRPALEELLAQAIEERSDLADDVVRLAAALGAAPAEASDVRD